MTDPTERVSGLARARIRRGRATDVGLRGASGVLKLLLQRLTTLDARLREAEQLANARANRAIERIDAAGQLPIPVMAEIRDAVARVEQDECQRYDVIQTNTNSLGERLDRIDAFARDTLARLEADSATRYDAMQGIIASLTERLDRLGSKQADLEVVLQRMETIASVDRDALARIEADAGRRFEALMASPADVVSVLRRLEQLVANPSNAHAAPIPGQGSEWIDLDVTGRITARTRSLRAIVAETGLMPWAESGPIRIRNDLRAPSALVAANSAITDFLVDRSRLSAEERLLWIVPTTTDGEISDDEAEQIFGLLGRPEIILRATVGGQRMLLIAGLRRREEILPLLRWSASALARAACGTFLPDSIPDDIRGHLVPVFDLQSPGNDCDPARWAERAELVIRQFKMGQLKAGGCIYGVTLPLAALDEPSSLDPWLTSLRSALGGAHPLFQWVRDPIPVARSGEVLALAERSGATVDLTATTRDMSGGAFAAYDDKAAYRPMQFDLRLPSPAAGGLVCIARRDFAAGATMDPYMEHARHLATRLRRVLRRDLTQRFGQAVAAEPSLAAGHWELHYIYNWRSVPDRFTQALSFDAELDFADGNSLPARAENILELLHASPAEPATLAARPAPVVERRANLDLQVDEHRYLAAERSAPSADSLRLASWLPEYLGETLELGSGYGVLAEHFIARTSRYVGVDLTVAQGDAIRRLGGLPLIADMHALPLLDAKFDTVIADNVIEHATDPVEALMEIRRVLKPGGRGFLVLPLDYLGPDYRNVSHHWKADVDSILSATATAELQVVRYEVCAMPAIGAKGSFPSCNQRTSLWEVQRSNRSLSGRKLTLDFRVEARGIDPTIAGLAERTSEDILALNARSQLDTLARKSPSLLGFDWSAYIKLSELRFTRAAAHLARRGVNGRVLDLGAYFGNLSLLLARCGWSVTALDSYKEYSNAFICHIELMRSQGIDVRDFIDVGFDLAGLKQESFDAVCCMGVIEHIPHTPRLMLAAIDRVLKPGGWLVIDTPNIAYEYQRSKLAAGRSIFAPLAEQFETDIPFEGHHREYTSSEVRWMMERLGYQNIEIDLFNYSIFGLTALVGEDLERFEAMQADPERRELIMAIARKPTSAG